MQTPLFSAPAPGAGNAARHAAWIAALIFWPLAAAAQDEPTFSIEPTLICLGTAESYGARRDCIGAGAIACMESNPTGYSTLGQGLCISQELKYWDARLNNAYQQLRAEDRQEDLEMDAANTSWVPSQAEALRDMQRAWIPFRDGKCYYERTQWTGGSGGGPAEASCLMYMTAEQALYLESQLGRL